MLWVCVYLLCCLDFRGCLNLKVCVHFWGILNSKFLPSSVQFQLASSVQLSLALILIITPTPTHPRGKYISASLKAELAMAQHGRIPIQTARRAWAYWQATKVKEVQVITDVFYTIGVKHKQLKQLISSCVGCAVLQHRQRRWRSRCFFSSLSL